MRAIITNTDVGNKDAGCLNTVPGGRIKREKPERLPELLAPAGSEEALEAAVKGGADAVYFGTTILNARMKAKNFDRDATARAIERAHGAGVRVFITMNTAVLDREYAGALKEIEYLYRAGADALIISDIGLAATVHSVFPDIPLHASTQASGHNSEAAAFLQSVGFSRMVCARELKKEDIELLVERSPIPIEMFIHGAACVSASGQCLFSSLVGGRSGNRGECAQPCRMSYNGGYPLSLKDICLAGHITEILETGVASLKIEGRMKSPDYVRAVTAVYRRLLDERRNADRSEIEYLASVFSRGGFTDGYFTGRLTGMNGVRSEQNKSNTRGGAAVIRTAPRGLPPIKPPERGAALPDGGIKTAGRKEAAKGKPVRSARWYKPERMAGISGFFDINYIPLGAFDRYSANGVLLPPVIPDTELEGVKNALAAAKRKGACHALVGNIGQIEMVRRLGFTVHGDYRLNLTSGEASAVYAERGFSELILSPELTLPQIRDINADKCVVVYGRVPLMTLEKSCGASLLRDRTGAVFPVICEGKRELVLNSAVTYMADKEETLRKAGPLSKHFIFTVESRAECEAVINAYKKGLAAPSGLNIRRIK